MVFLPPRFGAREPVFTDRRGGGGFQAFSGGGLGGKKPCQFIASQKARPGNYNFPPPGFFFCEGPVFRAAASAKTILASSSRRKRPSRSMTFSPNRFLISARAG